MKRIAIASRCPDPGRVWLTLSRTLCSTYRDHHRHGHPGPGAHRHHDRDQDCRAQGVPAGLDAGEEVSAEGGAALSAAGEVLSEVPNLMDAIMNADIDEIDRITAFTEERNDRIDPDAFEGKIDAYNALASKCRAAGK